MSPMSNPPHPGETVRFECIQSAGLTVTEAARRLGCSRPALSRVLNGRAAVSADMALAFEREGWSNADFWCAAKPPTIWRRRGGGRSRPSAPGPAGASVVIVRRIPWHTAYGAAIPPHPSIPSPCGTPPHQLSSERANPPTMKCPHA